MNSALTPSVGSRHRTHTEPASYPTPHGVSVTPLGSQGHAPMESASHSPWSQRHHHPPQSPRHKPPCWSQHHTQSESPSSPPAESSSHPRGIPIKPHQQSHHSPPPTPPPQSAIYPRRGRLPHPLHSHASGPHTTTLQVRGPPTPVTDPRSPQSLDGFHTRAERLTELRETLSFLH